MRRSTHRTVVARHFLAIALCVWLVAGSAAQAPGPPLLAPVNPDFADVLDGRWSATMTVDGHPLTAMPEPMDYRYLRGHRYRAGLQPLDVLPSSYDLRSNGRLTAIRDQGSCGSCWAFAAMGSLESGLLTYASESWDFSENYLKDTHGFDYGACAGGNSQMATAYFARWSGPVAESDDPYNAGSSVSPAGLPPRKHVQDVTIVPDRAGPLDNDNIKRAVMEYGDVATTMYWDSSAYNGSTHAYCLSTAGTATNHGVGIVGWDDNYDASRFASPPAGNGAFLIRNSWGTWWGESGYFWISYYDTRIGRYNYAFDGAEPASNYARVYQYDPYGQTSSAGYGSSTSWGANVFVAAATEQVAAVSTYALVPGTSYTMRVYVDPTSGPVASAGPAVNTTGTFDTAGYHTVRLASPVAVSPGHKFSVVFGLTTPGYSYSLPFEFAYAGYSSAATASAGQSYMSSNGTSWADVTSWGGSWAQANICIKAFTTLSTTLAVGTAPGQPGDTVQLSATLSVGATPVSGETVAFTLGGNPAGSATTDASGIATVSYTIPGGATSGDLTVGATFAGDGIYAACSAVGTLTVSAPAVEIAASDASGRIGQTVILSATLKLAGSGDPVTGETLRFEVDGAAAGTAVTGAGGSATVAYAIPEGTGAGTRAITVAHDATSTTGAGTLTVAKGCPGLSLYAAKGMPGQTVNLKTVFVCGSKAILGRTVQFSVDGSAAGSAVSDASGATLAWKIPASISAGTHNVTAAFTGDAAYAAASRTTAALTVTANVAFSLYAAAGTPGQTVTLRSLMLSGGSPVIGRTVQFFVDGGVVGTATSDASGVALAYAIPASMTAGAHNVTVSFAGDGTYNAASRTTAALTVAAPKANVVFSLYAASGAPGDTVTLKSLMLAGGAAVIGKTVQFAVDGSPAGTGVSSASGVACAFTIPVSAAIGVHSVTVSFAGDASYNASTRTTAALTVR